MKFVENEINPNYKVSLLPGLTKGVSGTILSGYNLGINKYSEIEKRDEVITAFKYLISKEMQKKLVINYKIVTAMKSLYDDEEVCLHVDCELYKNAQPIGRPTNLTDDYDKYSSDFRTIMYEYLYGNATAIEVVKKIDDITRIHYISIEDDHSALALISYILLGALFIFILLSSVLLFIRRYKPYFNFLPNDFWFLIIIGILFFICTGLTEMGPKQIIKCQFNLIFMIIGLSFVTIPILYKLIVNIPLENKYSNWVANNKYIFLFIFINIDVIHLLLLLSFYSIQQIILDDKENFEICELKKNFLTTLIVISIILIKLFIFLIILGLIYIEWSLKITYYELRFTVLAIYTNILIIILLLLVENIKIENYITYFILKLSLSILTSVVNYTILYFVYIINVLMKKHNIEATFINRINKKFIESHSTTNNNKNYSSVSETNSFRKVTKNYNTTTTTIANNYANTTSTNINDSKFTDNFNNSNNSSTNNTTDKSIVSNKIFNFIRTIDECHSTTEINSESMSSFYLNDK